MAESIISATDMCLSYGHEDLLNSASLAIHEGDKAGLVGRNGCGKSSFLRILAGEENPDSGNIARRQGLVVGYLPQEFQLDEALTVAQARDELKVSSGHLLAAMASLVAARIRRRHCGPSVAISRNSLKKANSILSLDGYLRLSA